MTLLCSLVPRYDDILQIIDILKCFFTHVNITNYFHFGIKKSTLEKIMSKQCNNKADVDEINSLLVKTLQDAADILSLSQKLQSKASRKLNAKEPWYDEELSTLKRKINRHSRWLCKYPQNSTQRVIIPDKKGI